MANTSPEYFLISILINLQNKPSFLLTTTNQIMKKYLLKTTPAKADFGGTVFVIGIVVGIATAEISHYNFDKKDKKAEEK